jgi:transposase
MNSNIQGARNPNARLSEQNVITIRRRYAAGVTQRELCKVFGVSHNTIARIVHRETWGWLEDDGSGAPPMTAEGLPPLTPEQEAEADAMLQRLRDKGLA